MHPRIYRFLHLQQPLILIFPHILVFQYSHHCIAYLFSHSSLYLINNQLTNNNQQPPTIGTRHSRHPPVRRSEFSPRRKYAKSFGGQESTTAQRTVDLLFQGSSSKCEQSMGSTGSNGDPPTPPHPHTLPPHHPRPLILIPPHTHRHMHTLIPPPPHTHIDTYTPSVSTLLIAPFTPHSSSFLPSPL